MSIYQSQAKCLKWVRKESKIQSSILVHDLLAMGIDFETDNETLMQHRSWTTMERGILDSHTNPLQGFFQLLGMTDVQLYQQMFSSMLALRLIDEKILVLNISQIRSIPYFARRVNFFLTNPVITHYILVKHQTTFSHLS